MSRYGSDDDMESVRRRHAQRDAEEWAKDREETNRQWRESEARRRREHWESAAEGMPQWEFRLAGEGEGGAAYNAFLNGHKVALVMVIHRKTRSDIVIFTTEEPGTLNVYYPHGRAPDQRVILDAFQQQIGDGR